MRAWTLKADARDLDGLVLEDRPIPEPGPGEVRVRVRAVTLNFRDQDVLRDPDWRVPGKDIVPIADGAGHIDAVGHSVEVWREGDPVTTLYFDWLRGPPWSGMGRGLGSLGEDGVLAEYVVLPAARVMAAPQTLSMAEAAAIPCAGVTAWAALNGNQLLPRGSKVLVLGTGGVALMALLIARAAGAEVLATTSQESKRQRLLDLGASDVINYRTNPDWGRMAFERTGGVHRVVNVGGAGQLNASVAALAPGGEVANVGTMTGTATHFDVLPLMVKNALVRGTSVGNAEAHRAVTEFVDHHRLKPPIYRRYPLEQAKDAYRAQGSPELFGKIVIDVA